MTYHIYTTEQLTGPLKKSTVWLLERCGLRDENDTDYTVLFMDEDENIVACGSLKKYILKQIAVAPEAEGDGLCAAVVSELVTTAVSRGETELFLFTKPKHINLFSGLGFYPIISTVDTLMMENRRNGITSFLNSLPRFEGRVGAIVCNCNPFTLGHRWLIEQASAQCDKLIIFVLAEEQPMFPSADRLKLVKDGTADIENVTVVSGGRYLISQATFPTYFIKEQADCVSAACRLDVELFAKRIAPTLNISVRFVGKEPFDPVTREYNETIKAVLPQHSIEVVEFPRYRGISASTVRKLIEEGRVSETEDSLPKNTYEYCQRRFGTGS